MQNNKTILHICSYYIGNKLYKYLFNNLEKSISFQFIYVPIRKKDDINKNILVSKHIKIYYDLILKKYHKFFYGTKIKHQKKNLLQHLDDQNIDIKSFSLIHAHTLFSDGGTAYLLNKEFNIPYIVNIRNTDINSFYKLAIHYRSFSHKILLKSKYIIFISYAYKKQLYNLLPKSIVDKIEHKSFVIPNAIDNLYFENQLLRKIRLNDKKIRIITSASLEPNKNIITSLKIILELKKIGYKVQYEIAGKGNEIQNLRRFVTKNQLTNQVKFLGYLDISELIKRIDNSEIFLLLSYKETFGISYIEAIARGKPIIYTRNQGIDGFFSEGRVGYAVEPDDIRDAVLAIQKIISSYDVISARCIEESKIFNWDNIASIYAEAYHNALVIK